MSQSRRIPSPEAGEQVSCRDCGYPYSVEGKHHKRPYIPVAGGAICRDRRSCRARQLATQIGLDLYSRNPRERLISRMDIRPADWRKKHWQSAHTEEERVEAAVEYFSWCFPISMTYAVQIDADDEIIKDRYGKPVPHTHVTLAAWLNLSRSNVSRAIKRCERRHRIFQSDGRIGLVPKPKLTPEERAALDDSDRGWGNGVPRKYRGAIRDLLDGAPAGIRTDTVRSIDEACTRFNAELAGIRTARDQAIEQACIAAASFMSRVLTFKTATRQPSSVSGGLPKADRGPSLTDGDAGQEEHKQLPAPLGPPRPGGEDLDPLYAAGLGQGALAKLPVPRPSIDAIRYIAENAAIEQDAAATIYARILEIDATVTKEETVQLIEMKRSEVHAAILSGKIEQPTAYLITYVPKLAQGPHLAMARKEARRAEVEHKLNAQRDAQLQRELAIYARAEQEWRALTVPEQARRRAAIVEKLRHEPWWKNVPLATREEAVDTRAVSDIAKLELERAAKAGNGGSE